jgi:hypothetical protein
MEVVCKRPRAPCPGLFVGDLDLRTKYKKLTQVIHVWLGWAYFHKSALALAPRGLLRSAYDFLCLIYTKKYQGIAEDARAVLTYARSYTQKSFFGPPSEALVAPSSIQKPSQKHQNLTSVGLRFRSSFFLCPIQNLKAVTMGMVTARALFWSNKQPSHTHMRMHLHTRAHARVPLTRTRTPMHARTGMCRGWAGGLMR